MICNIFILFCNNVWCNNQLKFMTHMIRKLTLNRIQLLIWIQPASHSATFPLRQFGLVIYLFCFYENRDEGFEEEQAEEGKQAEWREGSGLHVSRHIEELWLLKTTYQHWKSPELPHLTYTYKHTDVHPHTYELTHGCFRLSLTDLQRIVFHLAIISRITDRSIITYHTYLFRDLHLV